MEIMRPNQVWAMDITYIPMTKGFVYLACHARLVFAAGAVVARLHYDGGRLLRRGARRGAGEHGKPEIVNTDQGSQFTGAAFTGVLTKHEIKISMDGKGAWRLNVFLGSSPRTSRLSRTLKYEKVYLHAYDRVPDARTSIRRYLDLYNRRRPLSSLDGMMPDQAYNGAHSLPPVRSAA
jgi:putative transposase